MRRIGILGSVTALWIFAPACGVSFSGNSDNGSVAPPPCEATASPKTVACVVDERFGVFVSSSGSSDGADGTKAHPFPTIQAGIEAAHAASKNVYACMGEYSEQVKLVDGTSVYGFFDCSQDWKVTSSGHAIVTGASPALTADQIVTPTRIEAVDFKSNDAAPNETSIAAIITRSTALTLANLTIQSGAGGKGDDGAVAAALTQPNADGAAGYGGDTTSCHLPKTPTYCEATPAAGGNGTCVGPGGYVGGSGGSGGTGMGCNAQTSSGCPPLEATCCTVTGVDHLPDNGTTPVSTPSTAAGATTKENGANPASAGAAGKDGMNGANATVVGDLSESGYTPSDGSAGKDGAVGQGGGGGAGYDIFQIGRGYGGAGGGAGGCPGLAGGAGKGGGASIGVLIVDSPVTFDTCNLQSGPAGAAGAGDIGSDPTPGGAPGTNPFPSRAELAGGHGGPGGASGWSGNGFPGPSYAVAAHGTSPTFTNCTQTPSAGGPAIAAKTAGNKTIPATPPGPSEPMHAF